MFSRLGPVITYVFVTGLIREAIRDRPPLRSTGGLTRGTPTCPSRHHRSRGLGPGRRNRVSLCLPLPARPLRRAGWENKTKPQTTPGAPSPPSDHCPHQPRASCVSPPPGFYTAGTPQSPGTRPPGGSAPPAVSYYVRYQHRGLR